MNFSLNSNFLVKSIRAEAFTATSGNAILSFNEGIGRGISLHVPPSVAEATAKAFNDAMAAHEAEGKLTLADFVATEATA